MDEKIYKLVLSIRVLEQHLARKKERLKDIRSKCKHVWEIHEGFGEKGEVLFKEEICKFCGIPNY